MTDERRATLTLVICCIAQFMVILDVSIVNVALPSISEDLGFTPASLAWVVNAYTLAFAGFLLLGGRAADLLGRREVFAAGLALFALASLAGGLAQNEVTLVAARAAQGLGGAVVAPATLSILTTSFPEGLERNRALGLWGAMGAIGGASGALLGGLLTEALSWRWILFINVPIGLLGALSALHIVRAGRRDVGAARDFDLAGALTVTLGLVVVTYGIVETDSHGWGSARTLLTLAAGAALLVVFVLVEGRLAPRPLVPLRIFASRLLSGANVVVFCLGGSVFAMWYFLSLYLQQVLGYSPIEAGLAFLPMPLTIAGCTQAATRLTGRLGAGPVLAAGMAMIALGMLLFTGLAGVRRRLPVRRAGAVAAVRRGHRVLVRPGHDRRDRRRAGHRGRPGVGARQYLAPDGRLGRPGPARRRRDPAHGRARRRRLARRGAHRRLPPRVRARQRDRAGRRARQRIRGQSPSSLNR
jgi:EmrB/QacA subfamily drug resistance transporter